MKKLTSLILTLSLVLSLVGCGQPSGTASGTNTQDPASSAAQNTNLSDTSTGDTSADITDINGGEVPEGSQPVSVETAVNTITFTSGGIEKTYADPVVTVPANEDAQKAIQASLDAEVENFRTSYEGILDESAQMLETYSEGSTGDDPAAAMDPDLYAELTMRVARADSAVLSIVFEAESYTGGAHGSATRWARNYDVKTGEELTFEKLGSGFRAAAEEQVLAQAETYQADTQALFEDYPTYLPLVVADGTERMDDVYAEIYSGGDSSVEGETDPQLLNPSFYLDDNGVNFISDQYVMQPYASGIIEFPIPYAELDGVLDAQYAK